MTDVEIVKVRRKRKRKRHSELKYKFVPSWGTVFNNDDWFTTRIGGSPVPNICGITRGPGYEQRVGSKVRIKNIQIRGKIHQGPILNEAVTVEQLVRLVVLVDYQNNQQVTFDASTPWLAAPFNEIYEPLDPSLEDRFQILYDKVFDMTPNFAVPSLTEHIGTITVPQHNAVFTIDVPEYQITGTNFGNSVNNTFNSSLVAANQTLTFDEGMTDGLQINNTTLNDGVLTTTGGPITFSSGGVDALELQTWTAPMSSGTWTGSESGTLSGTVIDEALAGTYTALVNSGTMSGTIGTSTETGILGSIHLDASTDPIESYTTQYENLQSNVTNFTNVPGTLTGMNATINGSQTIDTDLTLTSATHQNTGAMTWFQHIDPIEMDSINTIYQGNKEIPLNIDIRCDILQQYSLDSTGGDNADIISGAVYLLLCTNADALPGSTRELSVTGTALTRFYG